MKKTIVFCLSLLCIPFFPIYASDSDEMPVAASEDESEERDADDNDLNAETDPEQFLGKTEYDANITRENIKELGKKGELSGAQFWLGADFSRLDLEGIDLSNIRASGALFIETKLNRANLSGAIIPNVSFRDTNISNTKFEAASLPFANMTNVDAEGAIFEDANLLGVTWKNAFLKGCKFGGSKTKMFYSSKSADYGKIPSLGISPSIYGSYEEADFRETNFLGIHLEVEDDQELRTVVNEAKSFQGALMTKELAEKLGLDVEKRGIITPSQLLHETLQEDIIELIPIILLYWVGTSKS